MLLASLVLANALLLHQQPQPHLQLLQPFLWYQALRLLLLLKQQQAAPRHQGYPQHVLLQQPPQPHLLLLLPLAQPALPLLKPACWALRVLVLMSLLPLVLTVQLAQSLPNGGLALVLLVVVLVQHLLVPQLLGVQSLLALLLPLRL
jgi:hypothetical protein